jgi:hypothetical protein
LFDAITFAETIMLREESEVSGAKVQTGIWLLSGAITCG